MEKLAINFLIFIFGLCVGSFLNVLIYRLPRLLPITGRSFCPKCKKKIAWYDNIPLLSFILLRGKCRFCHSPIEREYPLVELLTGVLFVWTAYFFYQEAGYWDIKILGYWVVMAALIVIFFTDLKHRIIPDQVIFVAVLTSLLISLSLNLFISSLLVALGSALFFFLLHLATRGQGMGLGDVKLAFLIGFILGFPKTILAFYLAFLTGAFGGVILILAGKKKFDEHIPFGPFLTSTALVALFWGEGILKWITARFF